MWIRRYQGEFIALSSGCMMPLAFAPFPIWLSIIAIFSPLSLFILWHDCPPKRAALRGFLYGLGMFGVGVTWVNVSFYSFGGLPLAGALMLTIGFVLILASYIAALGWCSAYFFPDNHAIKWLLALPTLWVSVEWIRSWFLSGFPWLSVGYSQIDTVLNGYAPIFGVFGVSFAVLLITGALACFIMQKIFLKRIISSLLLLMIIAGGYGLQQINWEMPVGKPLDVVLVQGNVPQEYKWDASFKNESLRRYWDMSIAHRDADLIVWPETAIPFLYHQVIEFIKFLENEHKQHGVDFLIGIPVMHNAEGKPYPVTDYDNPYFNGVHSISANPGFYYKNHLVPFGEYIPFSAWFGNLLKVMDIPLSEFTAGAEYQPNLRAAGHSIGVSICYEDAFGERVRTTLPEATLLVNVSNDTWFGDTLAPHQHLQIARMRALESARYLLRATNTGVSAIINPRGEIIAESPQFELHALRTKVQPMQGVTPYILYGEILILSVLAVCLFIAGGIRYWIIKIEN